LGENELFLLGILLDNNRMLLKYMLILRIVSCQYHSLLPLFHKVRKVVAFTFIELGDII
jgi:hypothetical protein